MNTLKPTHDPEDPKSVGRALIDLTQMPQTTGHLVGRALCWNSSKKWDQKSHKAKGEVSEPPIQ